MSAVDLLRDALFGTPPSPTYEPSKEGVLKAVAELVADINTIATFGSFGKLADDRASLDADLNHVAGTLAFVYEDSIDANNDFYYKVGASGTGSWTLTSILHDMFDGRLEPFVIDAEAARDDAETARDEAVDARDIAELARDATIAAAGGNFFVDLTAGEAGTTTGQFFSHGDGAGGVVFRVRTGGGSTILAEAATVASVNKRMLSFASRATIESLTIDGTVQGVNVMGFATANDGGDGVYRRVGAEPAHTGKAQSDDGQWWELVAQCEGGVRANQLGVFASADTTTGALADANASAINAALVRYKKVFIDRPATVGHFYYTNVIWQPPGSTLWGDDMGVWGDTDELGTCLYGKASRPAHVPVVGNITTSPANLAAADRNIKAHGFTVHGNKVNQTGGNEWSHGVQAYSVIGGDYFIRAVHCKGDGWISSYGYNLTDGPSDVPCNDINGGAISEDCDRMGTAHISCVRSKMRFWVYRAGFYAWDIEPDNTAHIIDDIDIDLYAEGCGVNGSGGRGGIAVGGVTGQKARNVRVRFMMRDIIGAALYWREVEGFTAEGQVHNITGNVIDTGANGGGGGSTVDLDVKITGAVTGSLGRTWDNGGRLNGRLIVEATVGTDGFTIQDYSGGRLNIENRNGSAGSGTIGLTLKDSHNMDVSGIIAGYHNIGVWLTDASSGNRVAIEAGSNNAGGFAYDIVEASGCSNNVFRDLRRGTTISLAGTGSWAEFERNPGCLVHGDAILTLTPGVTPENVVVNTALTANRVFTLSTTNAVEGDFFNITRVGGAFNLDVGGVKTLAADQWGRFVYRGGAWAKQQFGSL